MFWGRASRPIVPHQPLKIKFRHPSLTKSASWATESKYNLLGRTKPEHFEPNNYEGPPPPPRLAVVSGERSLFHGNERNGTNKLKKG